MYRHTIISGNQEITVEVNTFDDLIKLMDYNRRVYNEDVKKLKEVLLQDTFDDEYNQMTKKGIN